MVWINRLGWLGISGSLMMAVYYLIIGFSMIGSEKCDKHNMLGLFLFFFYDIFEKSGWNAMLSFILPILLPVLIGFFLVFIFWNFIKLKNWAKWAFLLSMGIFFLAFSVGFMQTLKEICYNYDRLGWLQVANKILFNILVLWLVWLILRFFYKPTKRENDDNLDLLYLFIAGFLTSLTLLTTSALGVDLSVKEALKNSFSFWRGLFSLNINICNSGISFYGFPAWGAWHLVLGFLAGILFLALAIFAFSKKGIHTIRMMAYLLAICFVLMGLLVMLDLFFIGRGREFSIELFFIGTDNIFIYKDNIFQSSFNIFLKILWICSIISPAFYWFGKSFCFSRQSKEYLNGNANYVALQNINNDQQSDEKTKNMKNYMVWINRLGWLGIGISVVISFEYLMIGISLIGLQGFINHGDMLSSFLEFFYALFETSDWNFLLCLLLPVLLPALICFFPVFICWNFIRLKNWAKWAFFILMGIFFLAFSVDFICTLRNILFIYAGFQWLVLANVITTNLLRLWIVWIILQFLYKLGKSKNNDNPNARYLFITGLLVSLTLLTTSVWGVYWVGMKRISVLHNSIFSAWNIVLCFLAGILFMAIIIFYFSKRGIQVIRKVSYLLAIYFILMGLIFSVGFFCHIRSPFIIIYPFISLIGVYWDDSIMRIHFLDFLKILFFYSITSAAFYWFAGYFRLVIESNDAQIEDR